MAIEVLNGRVWKSRPLAAKVHSFHYFPDLNFEECCYLQSFVLLSADCSSSPRSSLQAEETFRSRRVQDEDQEGQARHSQPGTEVSQYKATT